MTYLPAYLHANLNQACSADWSYGKKKKKTPVKLPRCQQFAALFFLENCHCTSTVTLPFKHRLCKGHSGVGPWGGRHFEMARNFPPTQ